MAAIDSAQNSGNSSNPSVAIPDSPQAGDVDLFWGQVDASGTVFEGHWPDGAEHLHEIVTGPDGGKVGVAKRLMDGTESGNYVCGEVGGAAEWQLHVVRFRGRSYDDITFSEPTDGSSYSTVSNDSPIAVLADAVTAEAGDDLAYLGAIDPSGSVTDNDWTEPGDFTLQTNLMSTYCSLSVASRDNVSAGDTGDVVGTATFSAGSAGFAAYLVRLGAAGGGGTNGGGLIHHLRTVGVY